MSDQNSICTCHFHSEFAFGLQNYFIKVIVFLKHFPSSLFQYVFVNILQTVGYHACIFLFVKKKNPSVQKILTSRHLTTEVSGYLCMLGCGVLSARVPVGHCRLSGRLCLSYCCPETLIARNPTQRTRR